MAQDRGAAHFFLGEDKSIATGTINSDQLRKMIRGSPMTMTLNQAKLQYSLLTRKWAISKIETILPA